MEKPIKSKLIFEPYTIYSNNGRRDVINATSFQGACDALGRKESTFGFKGIDNRYEWNSEKQRWDLKKGKKQ